MITKENCKNIVRPADKQNNTIISFRIWTHMNNWIKKEGLNPRRIFIEACKELGYKE